MVGRWGGVATSRQLVLLTRWLLTCCAGFTVLLYCSTDMTVYYYTTDVLLFYCHVVPAIGGYLAIGLQYRTCMVHDPNTLDQTTRVRYRGPARLHKLSKHQAAAAYQHPGQRVPGGPGAGVLVVG